MNHIFGDDVAGVIDEYVMKVYPIFPTQNNIDYLTDIQIADALIVYGYEAYCEMIPLVSSHITIFRDTILDRSISLSPHQYGEIWFRVASIRDFESADKIKEKYPSLILDIPIVELYPTNGTEYLCDNIRYLSRNMHKGIMENEPHSKLAYAYRKYRENKHFQQHRFDNINVCISDPRYTDVNDDNVYEVIDELFMSKYYSAIEDLIISYKIESVDISNLVKRMDITNDEDYINLLTFLLKHKKIFGTVSLRLDYTSTNRGRRSPRPDSNKNPRSSFCAVMPSFDIAIGDELDDGIDFDF